MNSQEWRPIPGYEGLYEVSNDGQVRSLFRYKKVLKPHLRGGYHNFQLWKDKTGKYIGAHRLVAMAFIPNPYGLPYVNHKDECKLNNNVENLEWCTPEYNFMYGTAQQRAVAHRNYRDPKRLERARKLGLSMGKAIDQFTKDGVFVKRYRSANACAIENGWTVSSIRRAALGQFKQAYGFIFKEVRE